MNRIFPVTVYTRHDFPVADQDCPSWCIEEDEHEMHTATPIRAYVTAPIRAHVTAPAYLTGDECEVVVQRYDAYGIPGHVDIALYAQDAPMRHNTSSIDAASARRLANALLAAADLADGIQ